MVACEHGTGGGKRAPLQLLAWTPGRERVLKLRWRRWGRANLKKMVESKAFILDMETSRCFQRWHRGSRWLWDVQEGFIWKEDFCLRERTIESHCSNPFSFYKHFQFHYVLPLNFITKILVWEASWVWEACRSFMSKVEIYLCVCLYVRCCIYLFKEQALG